MNFQLVVSTIVDDELIINTYYKGCEIILGKMKTQVDLIKQGEMEYDLILGIDWLSTYHAHVDCHQKKITFKLKGAPEYVYEGMENKISIPVISAFKPTNLLRHGYQGFLATAIDK